ncbi:MAG: hypothetical protein ACRBFS_12360 [Aureispira sp.]
MHNSKLLLVYQSFTDKERALFKKWVQSPVHNKHKDVTQLFVFMASKKRLTPRTFQKKLLFQAIYPQKPYDDLRLRHILSLGVQLLENFVCFIEQKEDSFLQQKSLIRYYTNRNLEKFAVQHIQKAKQNQEQQIVQNSTFYYKEYELESILLESNEKHKRVQIPNIQNITDSYTIAFIIEQLKMACSALAYQNLNRKNHCNFLFLEHILALLKTGEYQDIIAIQFYYYSYLALAHPNESSYFLQLKTLLLEEATVLPPQEIKQIHIIAFNFCIKQLNTGNETYVQEVFELFQYGLEQAILIENNLLSRFTYKNIITAALRLKKTTWTARFIQHYTPYLEPIYQKSYQHFAQAKLLFTKGAYQQTIQLLHQVEFDDLFLNIDAKVMLLKIYYEEDTTTVLDAFLNSFYIYLQRKEIMGYHQENYKNLVKFTRKLADTPKFDHLGLQKIKQQIEQTKPLTERAWLLEQIQK